jgi:hypothetical protein
VIFTVTRSQAAAAAVGGLLAVLRFRRPSPRDTAFNDLARSEALERVRSRLQKPERAERVITGVSVICVERLPRR